MDELEEELDRSSRAVLDMHWTDRGTDPWDNKSVFLKGATPEGYTWHHGCITNIAPTQGLPFYAVAVWNHEDRTWKSIEGKCTTLDAAKLLVELSLL